MYYIFKVSSRRARRNALGTEFDSQVFEGWKAWREELRGKKVLVCLRALAMGDSIAVKVAQHSHSNVLKKLAGALRDDEWMRHRHVVPRGPLL